ncbi:VanZ family protein [Halomonas denitrificans]|nr:VanZ family protein [Halomonas denitrificans]
MRTALADGPFGTTSRRERVLWLLALSVLAVIYATLGLAARLVDALGERGVLDPAFILAFVLIGAAIVLQGLAVGRRGLEWGVLAGVFAVYLMLFVRMGIPERSHLMEYGVLALLVQEALLERRSNGRRVPAPRLLAVAATGLAGVVDEAIQWVLPARVFDLRDVAVNVAAAVIAVLGSRAVSAARAAAGRSRGAGSTRRQERE